MQSRLAQIAVVAYFAVGGLYLWWRTFHTVNLNAPFVSIPFLLADYLGFGFFALFAVTLWTRVKRTPAPPAPGKSVDVFVTTYDEDPDLLRSTIGAVVAMRYPHATYVLDDGRRETVRALCHEFGVEYLTRPDTHGAKAGNINAALPRTGGDFIAFFDADHAPFENFLTELLGYFEDPRVALAQAPQSYYNLDSFQHARAVRSRGQSPWHEQSVFYDAILPGKDRWNSAFWCGSGAVIRREALVSIGGVDTRTVTEDMHTTMSLHAAGWRTVFHDRELAVGIAPDDASAFLGQRLRWTQGAMQIFRRDNPLLKRGLTWRQRISYFSSVAYVFEYVPKAIYLVTPIVALSLGALPMTNMGWNLLYRFVPYWVLGVVASRLLTGGTNPYFQSERFHLAKLTIALRAIATLAWPGDLKFNVTPKSGDGIDHRYANLRLIRWQVAAGVASVAAVIWAVIGFWTGAVWQLTGVSLAITTVWALYNAGMVASLTRSILQRHHRRHVYRFDIDVRAFVYNGNVSAPARVEDLSSIGAGWISPLAIEPRAVVSMRFETGREASVETQVRVVSVRPHGDGFRYGGQFVQLSEDGRRELVLFLYQQHAPTLFEGAGAGSSGSSEHKTRAA
ncbi:MAG TPA: glycosyltransferase [Dehalococcoidia bacterium]|nr:glycosyltransferase [Dehalococcoidia bacterium]